MYTVTYGIGFGRREKTFNDLDEARRFLISRERQHGKLHYGDAAIKSYAAENGLKSVFTDVPTPVAA